MSAGHCRTAPEIRQRYGDTTELLAVRWPLPATWRKEVTPPPLRVKVVLLAAIVPPVETAIPYVAPLLVSCATTPAAPLTFSVPPSVIVTPLLMKKLAPVPKVSAAPELMVKAAGKT